jgi:PleD family two-component response regulator
MRSVAKLIWALHPLQCLQFDRRRIVCSQEMRVVNAHSKPLPASRSASVLSSTFLFDIRESELQKMNIHQVLFLGDNCDATASWLAGLHRLQKAYSITIAHRQAISTYAAASFDLIIIEAEVSTMYEVLGTCRRLRTITNTPILLVSSIEDEEYALEVYEAGANEFIVKPVSLEILHAKLGAWRRWVVPAKKQVLLPTHDVVKVI